MSDQTDAAVKMVVRMTTEASASLTEEVAAKIDAGLMPDLGTVRTLRMIAESLRESANKHCGPEGRA